MYAWAKIEDKNLMTYKTGFIFGSHNHIPYGTKDEEFERIYTEKLKPFISALYQYPNVPAVLHYSGVLLYWIERNHPEFFMIISDLISRKQIELLGGGFYEPMMTLLPQADKIGQIEMLTTYIRKQFGKRPQGCWLPGSVWEQNMAGVLNTCGMAYTFLADAHFNRADIRDQACISEDQGKLITVFPLSGRLYAELGQKKASLVLEAFLKELPSDKEQLISVFPDGLFKGTGATKNSEKAVHQFFEALSCITEIPVELTLPTRFLKTHQDLKKAYFPNSSSRQFLITYPESNGVYSKMMFTHVLINQLRGDKARKQTAREELWKAQGYNTYSHEGNGGMNGDIYCNTLRNAAYKALLTAEKITREQGKFIPSLMTFDFDLDGEAEYLFQDKNINYYIKTSGAGIFELDYLPKAWNYLDTFARRRESYMEASSIEDGYRRGAFLDRLVPLELTLRDAAENRFIGSRFCGKEKYQAVEIDKVQKKAWFRLLPQEDVPFGTVEMEKKYHLKMDVLTLGYSLINRGRESINFKFIPQADFSFPGDEETLLRIMRINAGVKEAVPLTSRELTFMTGVELQDLENETVISLLSNKPFDLWIIPTHTQCRINETMTDQYQSTCIMPMQTVSLEPEERFETEFRLRVYH
jgi:hypothetical protein